MRLQSSSTTRGTLAIFTTWTAIKVILDRSHQPINAQHNHTMNDGRSLSQDRQMAATQRTRMSRFYPHLTRTIEFVSASISWLVHSRDRITITTITTKPWRSTTGHRSWTPGSRLKLKADNSIPRWRIGIVLNSETLRDRAPEGIMAPSEGEIRGRMKGQSRIPT